MSKEIIQIPAEQLRVGIYVSRLDRPWTDTPFLFQGFAIENDEELQTLRRLCKVVYVEVSAAEADRRGLVSELVERDALAERAVELASLIADLSPLGVQLTKRALQVNTDAASLSSALELENRNQVISHATDEAAARRAKWSQ